MKCGTEQTFLRADNAAALPSVERGCRPLRFALLLLQRRFSGIYAAAWVAAGLIGIFLPSTTKADGEAPLIFSASGFTVSRYINRNTGELFVCETNQFQCQFSNGLYSICLSATPHGEGDRTCGFQCVFDGINTYTARLLSTNLITSYTAYQKGKPVKVELKTPIKAKDDAILRITSGPVPPDDSDYPLLVVWFGLVSQSYYDGKAESLQYPLRDLDLVLRKNQIQFKTLFKRHDQPPGFLERREDYNEGYRYSREPKNPPPAEQGMPKAHFFRDEDLIFKRTPLEGEGASGYTNSVYSTVEWMDVSGLAFPKQVQMQLFSPTSSGKIGLCGFCSAYVTEVHLAEATNSFAVDVKPRASVMDSRGTDKDRYYFSTNGEVLTLDELKRDPTHGNIMQHRPEELLQKRKNKIFFTTIFLIVLFSPVLLIYKLKKK